MKKCRILILLFWLAVTGIAIGGPHFGAGGGSGTSFSVTDITGATDDSTPATTATAVLAQGGSLIESKLSEIATAVKGSYFGTLTNTKWCTTNGTLVACTENAPQPALGLLAGTLTNTYLCKYTAAGTLLSCDVDPATYQAAAAALASLAGLTETNGGIPYGTADNTYAWLAAGAEGTLLMGNGAGAPSFLAAGTSGYFLIAAGAADPVWTSQPTLAALEALTLTQGGILYATAADTPAILAKGTANQILRMNSGATAPEWTSSLNITNFNIDRQAGDGTYSGNTMSGTAGETLAFGQPVYMKSDGKFWLADADAAATMPALGLVVVGGNAEATVYVLTHGLITETDWNWTVGATIYVADGTAGAITATLADISDENDVVQVVGIAVHADSIFVNPSLTTVVLAAP